VYPREISCDFKIANTEWGELLGEGGDLAGGSLPMVLQPAEQSATLGVAGPWQGP